MNKLRPRSYKYQLSVAPFACYTNLDAQCDESCPRYAVNCLHTCGGRRAVAKFF